jgi:hypothetical protein
MTDTREGEDGHQTGFPVEESDFDADPRVSFSKLDNMFILETDEGEYEWDTALKRWIPVVGSASLRDILSSVQLASLSPLSYLETTTCIRV